MKRAVWLLSWILMLPSFAFACSCGGPGRICSSFWQYPLIFRGRVVELTLLREPPREFIKYDGTKGSFISPGRYRVRFQVEETFRGESREAVTIYTPEQSSACGFPFKNATEYVVFANADRSPGELSTIKCSPTHEFDSTKEDESVKWMREFPQAPNGVMIFGSIRPPNGAMTLPTTHLSIHGPENRDLVSDDKGAYSTSGLPPGDYSVSAMVPSGFSTLDARTVSVQNKGCAEVDWPLYYDGRLSGRVTDTSGIPLAKIPVVLLHSDPRTGGFGDAGRASTDESGNYAFSRLGPGQYFISANHHGWSIDHPYAETYFPNSQTLQDATPVSIGQSANLDRLDIALPRLGSLVQASVDVVLSDGSPASHATVNAFDKNGPSRGPVPVIADDNGQATVTLFDGRIYDLTATILDGTQQRCAGPLRVTAKRDLDLLPMKVEHWGNCLNINR